MYLYFTYELGLRRLNVMFYDQLQTLIILKTFGHMQCVILDKTKFNYDLNIKPKFNQCKEVFTDMHLY